MDDAQKSDIADTLIKIFLEMVPDANPRSMYGGTVFELEKDNAKSRIGGVYVYAEYVSMELAKGIMLSDPEGFLEGTGKCRRHIKLHCPEDIDGKSCREFLNQAVTLTSTA